MNAMVLVSRTNKTIISLVATKQVVNLISTALKRKEYGYYFRTIPI